MLARISAAAVITLLSMGLAPRPAIPEVFWLSPGNLTSPTPTSAPTTTTTFPASQPTETVVDRGTAERSDRSVTKAQRASLTVYLPQPATNTGTFVIICPGGGYGALAIDKEGHEIARWLNSLGVAAGVLKYRLPQDGVRAENLPLPIFDAQQAVRFVRQHADEWGISVGRVGIAGFSAGGHLASSTAVHFLPAQPEASDPLLHFSTRPDFAILAYPVISMKDGLAHAGSRRNLLGKTPNPADLDFYSNETQLTRECPPSFLVHAADDKTVKIENSRLFNQASKNAGVPSELVEFETSGHGFGSGRGESTQWLKRLEEWLRGRGLLTLAK